MFSRLFQSPRDSVPATFTGAEPVALGAKGISVPLAGVSYQFGWSDLRLEVRVDSPLVTSNAMQPRDVIIFDAADFYIGIGHFLRLSSGQRLVLDTRDEDLLGTFPRLSESAGRKIEIYHAGESLVFRQMVPDVETFLWPPRPSAEASSFESRRRDALSLVADIFGGPLQRCPPDVAGVQLKKLQTLLDKEPRRLADSNGAPGAVVALSRNKTAVLVGDLHGNVDNLLTILSWSGLVQSLASDEAVLVLLGDMVHPDNGPDLEDMDDSVLMLDLIVSLKLRFPANVFLLVGNHDSFSTDVSKGGVPQGVLWSRRIVELRGEEYRDRLAQIYEALPLIAYSPVFCACHAGPPQTKVSMDKLLDARRFPHLVHELTWTRQRMPGRPEGYTKKHARRFRKALGLSKQTPFIVGHYPRDEKGGIWRDVGGINGHHVVYSSRSEAIGIFAQCGDRMLPQILRGERLTAWLNQQILPGR